MGLLLRLLGLRKALWGIITRYPLQCALGASLLACAWMWHGWSKSAADYARFRNETADAQAKAVQAQVQVNRQPAILSRVLAEKSDHEAPAYYERVRLAAERVRKDSPRCPAATGVPGKDSAAPVDDGPGEASGMVSLAPADFDQLTAAAARLAVVQRDAQALIDAGVAEEMK